MNNTKLDRTSYLKEYSKEYRQVHRDKINARKKEWVKSNPEKVRLQRRKDYLKSKNSHYSKSRIYKSRFPEKQKEYQKKYSQSLNGRYSKYRHNAIKRGYEFELLPSEFDSLTQNKKCHYCGIVNEKIGLDRVINSIGYTYNNVVPCCAICNKLKGSMSKTQFINICIAVSKNFRVGMREQA